MAVEPIKVAKKAPLEALEEDPATKPATGYRKPKVISSDPEVDTWDFDEPRVEVPATSTTDKGKPLS